jgi:hypothetical protein
MEQEPNVDKLKKKVASYRNLPEENIALARIVKESLETGNYDRKELVAILIIAEGANRILRQIVEEGVEHVIFQETRHQKVDSHLEMTNQKFPWKDTQDN